MELPGGTKDCNQLISSSWLLESSEGEWAETDGSMGKETERGGREGRGDAPVRVDVAVEREDGGGRLRLRARAGRPAPQWLVPAHRRRR